MVTDLISPEVYEALRPHLHSLLALLIAGVWETIMFHLCGGIHAKLYMAQYHCQQRWMAWKRHRWIWGLLFWFFGFLKNLVILWSTGLWVAMLAYALLEMEEGTSPFITRLFWKLKLPMGIIYKGLETGIPYIMHKIQGPRRKSPRRHHHRRHESSRVELSRRMREP